MKHSDPESIRNLGIERLETRNLLSAEGFSFDDLVESRFDSHDRSGSAHIRFLASSPSAIRAQLRYQAYESIERQSNDHDDDDRRESLKRGDGRHDSRSTAIAQRSGSTAVALFHFSGSVQGSSLLLVLRSELHSDSEVSSSPPSLSGSDPIDAPDSGLTSSRIPSGESPADFQPPDFQPADVSEETINEASPSESESEAFSPNADPPDLIANVSQLVSVETNADNDLVDSILGSEDFRPADRFLILGRGEEVDSFDDAFSKIDGVGVPQTNLEVWLRSSAQRRDLLFELEDLLDAIAEDPAFGDGQQRPLNPADFGDRQRHGESPGPESEMILLRPVAADSCDNISSLPNSDSAGLWDSGIGVYRTFEHLNDVPMPEIARSAPDWATESPVQPVDANSPPTEPTARSWQTGERMMGVVACCLGIRYLRNRRQLPHQPK